MKKLASLFVAMLMLLSVVAGAFAQDAGTEATTETEAETTVETPVGDAAVEADATVTAESEAEEAEDGEETEVEVETEVEAEEETEVETEVTEAAEETVETAEVVETTEAEVTTEAVAETTVTEELAALPAEEGEAVPVEEVLTPTEVEEVGVTPDSPVLWGLERALERIELAITLGKAAKAKKGLQHARERHLELIAMMAQKKFKAAAKAQKAADAEMQDVEETVAEVEAENPETELGEEIALESEVEAQQASFEDVKARLTVKLEGKLTEEQLAVIASALQQAAASGAEIKVKIEVKKNKTKIKVKAKSKLSDEQLTELEETLKGKAKGKAKAKAKAETESEIEVEEKSEKGKKAKEEDSETEESDEDSDVEKSEKGRSETKSGKKGKSD